MIRSRLFLAFVAASVLVVPTPAIADLIMSITNVTDPSGGAGSFEVLLTNSPAGQSVDVASFSFALLVPTGAGIHFTAADTATVSATYIFAGTGGASVDPGFTLSLDTFPNTSFAASDTEFTFPSIAVNPGAVFGLGLISYSVAPSTLGGDVPILFNPTGTSLANESGGIDFGSDTSAGVIHVTATAIPEPSSLVLAAGALGMMLLRRGYLQVHKWFALGWPVFPVNGNREAVRKHWADKPQSLGTG